MSVGPPVVLSTKPELVLPFDQKEQNGVDRLDEHINKLLEERDYAIMQKANIQAECQHEWRTPEPAVFDRIPRRPGDDWFVTPIERHLVYCLKCNLQTNLIFRCPVCLAKSTDKYAPLGLGDHRHCETCGIDLYHNLD